MKNIIFPDHWECPKYHFGQMVKQGRIVGMEYHTPGTPRANELGEGWVYWVLLDELSNNPEGLIESEIEAVTAEELLAEIDSQKALIKLFQASIGVLTEQLEEVRSA